MREYTQTYTKVTTITAVGTGQAIPPPEGDGWTLHSWHPDGAHNNQYLLVMWERQAPSGGERDISIGSHKSDRA
jgi:hypothetical protein